MDTRDLSALTPYRAGGGDEEVARELGLDPSDLVTASSNENPFGPSPAAVEAIRDAAAEAHTYPKSLHTDLTAAIADEWDVGSQQVWLSPGGDGFLDYISRAFLEPGDAVLVPEPGFAYYAMSTRSHGGTVDHYHLRKEHEFDYRVGDILDASDGHRIIFVNNPHNPTGSEMSLADVERLAIETDSETLILVDEAYGEFSDNPSARQLLDDRDDVCVLRTFSKAYGLAGLRLGYGIVPDDWADAYERITTPFAVNALACHAGLAALGDDSHLTKTVDGAQWAREYIYENLEAPTWPSGGNFVLADVGDAESVTEAVKREGVIVRDCTSFGLTGCIRITCGTRDTTPQVVDTVNEVLTE